jgi:hypothetical protein
MNDGCLPIADSAGLCRVVERRVILIHRIAGPVVRCSAWTIKAPGSLFVAGGNAWPYNPCVRPKNLSRVRSPCPSLLGRLTDRACLSFPGAWTNPKAADADACPRAGT